MPRLPSAPPCEVRWTPAPPLRLRRGQIRRVAFVGPTGAGKTTTIAKLACELVLRGWRVHLVAADTLRMGAFEQLGACGDLLQIPVHPVSAVEGPFPDADVVLLDLPGVHPALADRVEVVRELLARSRPHEVHLVLSATSAPSILRAVQEGLEALRPSRAVLTHLDVVDLDQRRAVLGALTLPLSYVTYSPRVPGEIVSARSRTARRLLADGAHGAAGEPAILTPPADVRPRVRRPDGSPSDPAGGGVAGRGSSEAVSSRWACSGLRTARRRPGGS